MKKVIKTILLYLLAALLPFGLFVLIAETSPNPYQNSFTAAMADKFERLQNTEGQKIILVGGSSLPFGIRSDLIAEQMHTEVIDYGVYAALGTKVMLETSLAGIQPGDIVILAPELDPQTYSSYFNAEVLWEAATENHDILKNLTVSELEEMFYYYFKFSADRIANRNADLVSADSLYARSSFNQYGDLVYPHADNIMQNGYDSSMHISLEGLLHEEFTEMVKEYAAAVRKKGADIYFTFSPSNSGAVLFTASESDAFAASISEMTGCETIGSPQEMTYDSVYFYNTNYHLNDTGAILHTKNLITLLKAKLGIHTDTDIDVPEISKKEVPDQERPEDAITDKQFIIQKNGDFYSVQRVIGEAAKQTELRLPETYHGQPVRCISASCFSECGNLQAVYIPEQYSIFDIRVFSGCDTLHSVYLFTTDPGTTSVPANGLLEGASDELTIFVPESSYTSFISDYTWRIYRARIKKFNPED